MAIINFACSKSFKTSNTYHQWPQTLLKKIYLELIIKRVVDILLQLRNHFQIITDDRDQTEMNNYCTQMLQKNGQNFGILKSCQTSYVKIFSSGNDVSAKFFPYSKSLRVSYIYWKGCKIDASWYASKERALNNELAWRDTFLIP